MSVQINSELMKQINFEISTDSTRGDYASSCSLKLSKLFGITPRDLAETIKQSIKDDRINDIKIEMIDRFGLLPEPLKRLFSLTLVKLKAETLGIRKIDANINSGKIEFQKQTLTDPLSIVKLIQKEPNLYKLTGVNQLHFSHGQENADKKLEFISNLLGKLKLIEPKAA